MRTLLSHQRRLQAARHIVERLAPLLDLPLAIRLWDGTSVPLARSGPTAGEIGIAHAGVLGSLLRRPSLDNLFRHYVRGNIELLGMDLIACFDLIQTWRKQRRVRFAALRKALPWAELLPLLLTPSRPPSVQHQFGKGGLAKAGQARDKELIQFHYDASNEFYRLFLDLELVYSCAYFRDWENSLEQAQIDKLDLICRKLRLQPGQSFLDIGCGWGALLCHAARHYGVRAHGCTLSQAQHDHAVAKIAALGLADRIKVHLQDFRELTGSYDRIASVGMYEHVGIDNYPAYFKKIRSLLADGGVFLNHGITRRAKRDARKFRKASASREVILKYIFPGSELDHIGHTIEAMETAGFEVHDVDGLRRHYARTCRLWHDRLTAHQDEAIGHVGPERYRMWLAYLAGVTIGFDQGPLRLFQTVATKQTDQPRLALPPTREDVYA